MELAWLIPALPLAAFAIIGLITLRHANLSSYVTIAAIGIACAISWSLFFRVLAGETYEAQFPWLALDLQRALTFGIRVDPLSAIMLIVVTSVSLVIQFYSRGYLYEPQEEAHLEQGHPEANPAFDATTHGEQAAAADIQAAHPADAHGSTAFGAGTHAARQHG